MHPGNKVEGFESKNNYRLVQDVGPTSMERMEWHSHYITEKKWQGKIIVRELLTNSCLCNLPQCVWNIMPAYAPQVGCTTAEKGELYRGIDQSSDRSTFCGLRSSFEQSLCFRSTGNVWTPAYSRPRYWRQNARVEHALLEQLTLFPNASIVLEDVDTHRSNSRRGVNAQTKRRQSHVNTGTVSESENAGT